MFDIPDTRCGAHFPGQSSYEPSEAQQTPAVLHQVRGPRLGWPSLAGWGSTSLLSCLQMHCLEEKIREHCNVLTCGHLNDSFIILSKHKQRCHMSV